MNATQELELLDEILFHYEQSGAEEADLTVDATVRQIARNLAIDVTDQDVRVVAALVCEQFDR